MVAGPRSPMREAVSRRQPFLSSSFERSRTDALSAAAHRHRPWIHKAVKGEYEGVKPVQPLRGGMLSKTLDIIWPPNKPDRLTLTDMSRSENSTGYAERNGELPRGRRGILNADP